MCLILHGEKERIKIKNKQQPLYQQTVAIDWWHSSTGNALPRKKQKKEKQKHSTSLEKTKDLCKALMQILFFQNKTIRQQ